MNDIERQTFRDVGDESLHFRHQQLTKYTHAYSITFQMPAAAAANAPTYLETVLQVMEDADFHITHISGSGCSPVDSSGARILSVDSALDLFFPMAGNANRSDRGLSFKFMDPKTNVRLTEGQMTRNAVNLAAQAAAVDHSFLNFSDVFGPGYDYVWGRPTPFKYTLDRGARLKVLFQCVDGCTDTTFYHRVSMAFIGNRYAAS